MEDVNAYDLSKVEKLTVSEGDSVAQSDDAPEEADQVLVNNVVFEKAQSDELSNWVKLGVYREVGDAGQSRVFLVRFCPLRMMAHQKPAL